MWMLPGFTLICASALLVPSAFAAGSLDSLFEQESGKSSRPRTVAPHAMSRPKAGNLDALMEQEKQDEVHRRQIAEEKRRADEARQRQLAEEQRRQAEAQRQLAAEQERENAEARRRESNKTAGFWGAAMGIATGNKNMAAAYLDQGFSGEDNSAAVNSAMQQDVADYRQAQAEQRQRQAEAQRQQAEANRRQIDENNRRTSAYNQQQNNAYNQQQDGQRQQQEQQRQQQADQRQQKIAQDQQRKEQERANAGANACIFPHDQNGHRYLFNHCDTTVNVRWDDAQGGHSAVLYPGSRWNSATRVEGAWTASACVEPYHPRVEGGCF